MKPVLVDLFCGGGGCSVGYARAGFEVVGVDIAPQPHYPFQFHQADALGWLLRIDPELVAVIHASPPCPRYSVLRHANVTKGSDHPDLVGATRDLLNATGLPWVMENVPGAPMHPAVVLCGSMFAWRRTE